MKKLLLLLGIFMLGTTINAKPIPHCEVPCGIYHDLMRIDMIKEHITTIEKAMDHIDKLSAADEINYNQLVRWITTKEDHANYIQEIVEQYFMTQRIKPVSPDEEEAYGEYITQITLLHEMLIYAMKSKQTTDTANTEKLSQLLEEFTHAYFEPEELEHKHEH